MNGETSERASKRIKVESESGSASLNGSSSKVAKLEGADEEDVKQVLKEEAEAEAAEQAEELDDNYGIYEHYAQDNNGAAPPAGDLYLDTVSAAQLRQFEVVKLSLLEMQINRSVLDFDFERLCSVSLSNINVYACLVCGRYFQGRGKSSHAYAHSIHDDHHVYINLQTLKVSRQSHCWSERRWT